MSSFRIELLAPVGTGEALRAAVQNGADAVYLGGKQFSARQYADNFDLTELKEVVKYAHLYGVSVYIAINTLIDNQEFEGFIKYLYELYKLDVDAVIVQDLGAGAAVRRLLPEMELHASTQMTVHNAAGARLLEEMGFSRVILAREVSLENIQLMKRAAGVPMEVFVHGALCVSYSGQCLMSSMIGGRSGNRGRCAQPCRLPYVLVDSSGKELAAGHLLSPRDLNMLEHLPLLVSSGVISLKVEGRMKRPEYVATIIRNYRQALDKLNELVKDDEYMADPQAAKELAQIFNRDFTSGYFLEKPGPQLMSYQRPNNRGLYLGRVTGFDAMNSEVTIALEEPLRVGDGYEIWVTRGGRIAGEIKRLKQDGKTVEEAAAGKVAFVIHEGSPRVGDRVFKTLDIQLMGKARETFLSPQGKKRFPLDFVLEVKQGEPLCLNVADDRGNKARVTSEYLVEKAKKQPLTGEVASKQLGRLGNTVFYLRNLEIESKEDLMAPLSELNNLRRQAVEVLEKKILAAYKKPQLPEAVYTERVRLFKEGLPQEQGHFLNKTRISVTVGDMDALKAALVGGADLIYFGGEKLRSKKGIDPPHFREAVEECRQKGVEAVLMLPRVFQENKADEVRDYCEQGRAAGVDGFLVKNPGALQLACELGLTGIRGDYTLNVFNDYTVRLLLEYGVRQIALSPELTLRQIQGFLYLKMVDLECLVHGRMPLMITEHCAVGSLLGKGHAKKGCPMPCTREKYGLKDRMKMVFPLESDENCRMLVYNPKTLSMLDRLPQLLELGIKLLRIEAGREEAAWVKKVVALYAEEIRRCTEMSSRYKVREENIKMIHKLSPEGLTTGHFFRGVL